MRLKELDLQIFIGINYFKIKFKNILKIKNPTAADAWATLDLHAPTARCLNLVHARFFSKQYVLRTVNKLKLLRACTNVQTAAVYLSHTDS